MLRIVNKDESVECQAHRHGLRELKPVDKDYDMKYAAHKKSLQTSTGFRCSNFKPVHKEKNIPHIMHFKCSFLRNNVSFTK
jgi:hypothetical protein